MMKIISLVSFALLVSCTSTALAVSITLDESEDLRGGHQAATVQSYRDGIQNQQ
jgi:hypothetical protein